MKISLHFYQKIRTHSLHIERILLLQFPCGSGHCVFVIIILTKFWLELNFRILFPSKTCQTRCSSKNDLTKNCGYTKSVGRCEYTVCMKGALLNLVYHHKTTLQSMSNCVSSCLQHCYLYPCLIIGHQDLTKVDLMTNLLRPLSFEAKIIRS